MKSDTKYVAFAVSSNDGNGKCLLASPERETLLEAAQDAQLMVNALRQSAEHRGATVVVSTVVRTFDDSFVV